MATKTQKAAVIALLNQLSHVHDYFDEVNYPRKTRLELADSEAEVIRQFRLAEYADPDWGTRKFKETPS